MSRVSRLLGRVIVSAAVCVALGCAVAGVRNSGPVPAPTAREVRVSSLLCESAPVAVSLATFGVPADSQPVDVAISPEKITVLLDPSRLVTFSRDNPQSVDMIVGGPEESWRAIDRDPGDGSLWVASGETVSLLRIPENGDRSVIAGPPVVGRGGFRQIRVAKDAIYATPTGTLGAVWRLSREGKLLGQSFSDESEGGRAFTGTTADWAFWLARDLEGNVVGFDVRTGQLSRAGANGWWSPVPGRFPSRMPATSRSLHGEWVGTPEESWYFTDEIRGFLFLPDGPVFVGSRVSGRRAKGGALFRIREGKIETAIESCAENGLLMAVSDSSGFAAVVAGGERRDPSGVRRIISPQILYGAFHPGSERTPSVRVRTLPAGVSSLAGPAYVAPRSPIGAAMNRVADTIATRKTRKPL